MEPAALPADLDDTSRQALQVRLPAAVVCGTGQSVETTLRATRSCLQGYVRESVKQMLVALSPNIGMSAEHLLAQYEQLTPPEASTSAAPKRKHDPNALEASLALPSGLQLAFQHECL